MTREVLELERICEDPVKLLGTSKCLLCEEKFIAVATVEMDAEIQPYGLCKAHWGRFVDDDRQLIGQIEDAITARKR